MKPKPITTPLALPDSPFPMPQKGEKASDEQYLARIGKWYEHYYLQTFRTFTRAGIGKCMHPGYCHMDMCISLLTKGIVYVPQSERVRYYAPLKFVLDAIAHTWTDATAPALGALAHVQELQDAYNIVFDAQRSQDLIDKHCERIDRETDGLKDDLRKLSEILLSGTAKQSGEILAAVQDVKRELVAARGDIAAVGADAHTGRVAVEKLADELEGWREWIALCVRKSGGNKTDQAQTDAPQMFVAVRDAIYQLWQRFNAEPADCEMRDGSLRKPGQKRTYAECVEQYGATVVYTSPATGRKFYLSEYCPDKQALKDVINAARMAENRKHGAKNSPHKRRTPKRQK